MLSSSEPQPWHDRVVHDVRDDTDCVDEADRNEANRTDAVRAESPAADCGRVTSRSMDEVLFQMIDMAVIEARRQRHTETPNSTTGEIREVARPHQDLSHFPYLPMTPAGAQAEADRVSGRRWFQGGRPALPLTAAIGLCLLSVAAGYALYLHAGEDEGDTAFVRLASEVRLPPESPPAQPAAQATAARSSKIGDVMTLTPVEAKFDGSSSRSVRGSARTQAIAQAAPFEGSFEYAPHSFDDVARDAFPAAQTRSERASIPAVVQSARGKSDGYSAGAGTASDESRPAVPDPHDGR